MYQHGCTSFVTFGELSGDGEQPLELAERQDQGQDFRKDSGDYRGGGEAPRGRAARLRYLGNLYGALGTR